MTTSTSGHPAAQYLSDLINSFWAAPVVSVAAELGIPDRLAHGPQDAATLAEACGAHAPAVFRLLRALVTLGLARETGGTRFALTEAGQLLRADVPGSQRGRALFTGDMLWKQFGDLGYVVRTGQRTRVMASGPEGFAKLAEDPARLHAFQMAMAEGSVRAARAALAVHDFGRYRNVLDLGGGYGGVLTVLLEACPALRGAVLDLPYLESGAQAYLARAGVGARAGFLGGDFFAQVPSGFDAVVMKYIIHDWDDEPALRILANCRRAAQPDTRLLLLEQVVPERLGQERGDQAVIRADLTMMTVGGRERTAAEYAALFARSGWRPVGITAAGEGFSLIEARPAEPAA